MIHITRETTDIFSFSFASFGLSAVLLVDPYEFSDSWAYVVGFLLVFFGGFLHLIFKQLNRISDEISYLFIYLNFIGCILALVGIIIHDLEDYNGFWEKIRLELNEFIYGITSLLFLSTSISWKMKFE
ncbi:MAG: hypothetical protein ACW98K_18510 [Candidatus Kariarchaeaceae archaeon]|jgi:hypothetical protein